MKDEEFQLGFQLVRDEGTSHRKKSARRLDLFGGLQLLVLRTIFFFFRHGCVVFLRAKFYLFVRAGIFLV